MDVDRNGYWYDFPCRSLGTEGRFAMRVDRLIRQDRERRNSLNGGVRAGHQGGSAMIPLERGWG
jgi:hypothetical protein